MTTLTDRDRDEHYAHAGDPRGDQKESGHFLSASK